MSEKRYRVMDNDSKQLYCIESVDGEMFSMQEIVDLLNEQQATLIKQEQKIKHLREVLTEIYVMSVQESIISEERSENDE